MYYYKIVVNGIFYTVCKSEEKIDNPYYIEIDKKEYDFHDKFLLKPM